VCPGLPQIPQRRACLAGGASALLGSSCSDGASGGSSAILGGVQDVIIEAGKGHDLTHDQHVEFCPATLCSISPHSGIVLGSKQRGTGAILDEFAPTSLRTEIMYFPLFLQVQRYGSSTDYFL